MTLRPELMPFAIEFANEVRAENAAIFAGAGMSIPGGAVDWKNLLKDLASELNLDVDKEHDLVRVAQYHVNREKNRGRLTRLVSENFGEFLRATNVHSLLASMPIKTYWTTNYDNLIERSLREHGKVPDVKYEVKQMLHTKPRRDAIVYKMHGDFEHPSNTVLTRDDYEKYHRERETFLRALRGDLISKTFLFIGFSFSDPNIDYVLSRIRVEFTENVKPHMFFVGPVDQRHDESDEDFEYRKIQHDFFVDDLRSYGLRPIQLLNYGEIDIFINEVQKLYRRDTVFISGAAHDYSPWSEDDAINFSRKLAMELIKNDFRIMSGFGLGIGSAVIAGALEEILINQKRPLRDQLVTRPFPQASGSIDPDRIRGLWSEYRGQMLKQAGIAIFLFGNKIDRDNGDLVLSDGIREEFEIAKNEGLFVVPVGATGSMAEELWTEVHSNFSSFFPNASHGIEDTFLALRDITRPWDQILRKTVEFINLIRSS